jgi:hypothetical protein
LKRAPVTWIALIASPAAQHVATGAAGPLNDRIDEAYRSMGAGSPYWKPMIGARARSATVRVLPGG